LTIALWQERFGRTFYHFVYRNVLFLILCSEDPPGKTGLSADQLAYVKKTLADYPDVRWTIVALHKPLWTDGNDPDKTGWSEFEKLIVGRSYTVFAGHVHRYEKSIRQGMNHYQLATTGGGSKLRGVRFGDFDLVVWVTMKRNGPVLANLMLDGVYSEDLRLPDSDEEGHPTYGKRKPTVAVRGKLFYDGCSVADARVALYSVSEDGKKFTRVADAITEGDGSFQLSTYVADDGAPVGEYVVTAAHPGRLLPDKYAKPQTSDLRVTIKETGNDLTLELPK
jgi:3',5'-cyclic AMP phosphodiesterase CpdA